MSKSHSVAVHDEFSIDGDAFAVVASARQRTALRLLLSADDPVAVADLARDVVASDRDVDRGDVSPGEAERVYLDLHHLHLPKLADEDVVRYDDDRRFVEATDDAESLAPALDLAAQMTG